MNMKIIVGCLIVLLFFLSSAILYYIVNNLSDNTGINNTAVQPGIENIAEGADVQESISNKLVSNNKELLDQIQYQKVKTMVLLGTDERSTEISRSDIIMVVRIDTETNNVIIVSVPRDTKVRIPGHKNDKINHAFAFGGAELSVKTIEGLFGITVDNYFKFGFEDFKAIVDSFNGVEINAIKDFKQNGMLRIPKGGQVLSGGDALFYVRYRDDSEVDYGRIKRQQEVVRSLSNKILSFDREDVVPIISKLYSELVETDLDINEINGYLDSINEKGAMDIQAVTLKTHSIKTNGIWYEEFTEKDLNEAIDLLKGEKNGTGIYRD